MEKIIEKIEGIIDATVTKFEENPVKMSLKLLMFYLIFKLVWKTVKEKWAINILINVNGINLEAMIDLDVKSVLNQVIIY